MTSKSRPALAGENLAKSIIEMVHLMYQKKTAKTFLGSLIETLQEELFRRIEE